MPKPFYITTTLPYVNAEPHIGFAMEIIRADIIARAKKLAGFDVFFNTGTDEHGMKVYRKAAEQGTPAQAYVDGYADIYKALLPKLGISLDIHFVRTTDAHHKAAAQEFWRRVDKNGYIYKKDYSTKYCVGCELEKTESELVNGKCPLHPLMDIEVIKEENYFFKFSAFQKQLLDLYVSRPDFVVPDFRFNEIKAFVERGLEDFSISRVATKMPWGIPVPGDEAHVMYVWFDALVSYISTLGWPEGEAGQSTDFQKWWIETGGVVQYCGKDNLRQQSATWQAMLMAAGLTPSRTIVIDGFVTGEGGLKMSKSLGNTVSPLDIIAEYGIDALRYYVAREIHPFEDSPFTMAKFKEAYNANLANGIGNLTSRVMKMAEANGVMLGDAEKAASAHAAATLSKHYDTYEISKACDEIWGLIQESDKAIQTDQPFKTIKVDAEKGKAQIMSLLASLYKIGHMLAPILPDTSAAIVSLVESGKSPAAALFMRK